MDDETEEMNGEKMSEARCWLAAWGEIGLVVLKGIGSVLGLAVLGALVVLVGAAAFFAASEIALVSADNGPSNRAIEELDILELAAAQAGLAFENELLRRQAAHAH